MGVVLPEERIVLLGFNGRTSGTAVATFGHALSVFNTNFASAWNIANQDGITNWTLISDIADNLKISTSINDVKVRI